MATLISWTNETWNPTTGCSRVSDGCRNCYAEGMSLRFGWSKKPWTHVNAEENVKLHPDRLRKPYSWKKPSKVFVNSMSDLFHELIPDDFIAQVFAVMGDTTRHTYQILTKRAERAASWSGPWAENIWMGVSVEDEKNADRIDSLKRCGALTKFVSYEPALGPLGDVDLSGIDWLICGGESGQNHRRVDMAWARRARDLCVKHSIAFFFKQDSGPRTEMRPWVVEEDGTKFQWHQYPGNMEEPTRVTLDHPQILKGQNGVSNGAQSSALSTTETDNLLNSNRQRQV